MAEKISILGCGWLGLPLAISLLERGYEVSGTTTRPERLELLTSAGIDAYHLEANPDIKMPISDALFNVDCLIVNIPPKVTLKGPDFHIKQLIHISEKIKPTIKKLIFVSSTSVYPDLNREVFEQDASEAANAVLFKAEKHMLDHFENAVIIRMAGLMGPDRYPAKYFAGKKGLSFGSIPVNYIHQKDAVGLLASLVDSDIKNGIFNAVAPHHPIRQDVYLKNCIDMGLEVPEFIDAGPQPFKRVNGDKIANILDYPFVFPDPLKFTY